MNLLQITPWQLLRRLLKWQLVVGLVLTAALSVWAVPYTMPSLLGCVLAMLGTAVFGLRAFMMGEAHSEKQVTQLWQDFWRGAVLKFALCVVGFALIARFFPYHFWVAIVSWSVTQLGVFWVALRIKM